MNGCVVTLEGYHGPLDLLYYLIRQKELDILDVALAKVTETYLEYLQVLLLIDIDDVGEFVVLASNLIELKARAMLPVSIEEQEAEEEDSPREQLVRQLNEYKRFKEATSLLATRAMAQRQRLRRLADDLEPTGVPEPQKLRAVELWDLVSAFSRLLKEHMVVVTTEIPRDPTPITVYMDRLEELIRSQHQMTLAAVLAGGAGKAQLIGRFLAILELIKQRRVWVEWDETGTILLSWPCPLQSEEPGVPDSMPMADESIPPDVPVPLPMTGSSPAEESADRPAVETSEDAPASSAWAGFQSIFDEFKEVDRTLESMDQEIEPPQTQSDDEGEAGHGRLAA